MMADLVAGRTWACWRAALEKMQADAFTVQVLETAVAPTAPDEWFWGSPAGGQIPSVEEISPPE